MKERKVRDIPGVGGVMETQLRGIGVHNCADVLDKAIEVYICFTEN